MSKGLKIFLIIVAVVCGGGVLVMAAGYFFVKSQAPGLVENSRKTIEEGAKYGRGKKDALCVTHVMKRAQPCGEYELKCQVGNAVYLQACLKASQPTTAFCAAVPSESQLMESVKWRVAVCKSYPKVKPRVCQSIQAMVQKHCKSRKRLSLR